MHRPDWVRSGSAEKYSATARLIPTKCGVRIGSGARRSRGSFVLSGLRGPRRSATSSWRASSRLATTAGYSKPGTVASRGRGGQAPVPPQRRSSGNAKGNGNARRYQQPLAQYDQRPCPQKAREYAHRDRREGVRRRPGCPQRYAPEHVPAAPWPRLAERPHQRSLRRARYQGRYLPD